ncbi:MAG: hypothetical protein KatS3mg061_2739 [Dehalococcoidia bacterium]|nr:MAG: hypothetical protein KatS3mg061_2739 [Dehalococcoidia bacterium]
MRAAFVHRTGHNLGEEVHGEGVNLDDLETHDERQLLPGTAVSVEPGIYLEDLGVRSEVNVIVHADRVEVTGDPQPALVALLAPRQLRAPASLRPRLARERTPLQGLRRRSRAGRGQEAPLAVGERSRQPGVPEDARDCPTVRRARLALGWRTGKDRQSSGRRERGRARARSAMLTHGVTGGTEARVPALLGQHRRGRRDASTCSGLVGSGAAGPRTGRRLSPC